MFNCQAFLDQYTAHTNFTHYEYNLKIFSRKKKERLRYRIKNTYVFDSQWSKIHTTSIFNLSEMRPYHYTYALTYNSYQLYPYFPEKI